MKKSKYQTGFTIVELLIVIVVIGILVTITVIAYSGIQERARRSLLVSELKNAATQLSLHQVSTSLFPTTLAATNSGQGIKANDAVTYQYAANNSGALPTYCLTGTIGALTYSVSPDSSVPIEGTCSGLLASYYPNITLSGAPSVQQIEPSVNYVWSTGSPLSGIGTDNFSVRWSGFLTAPTTGTYTFYATSDDGERLFVNGVLLVDKWIDQGGPTWSATIGLNAGQKVPLVYEMYERSGNATARLEWLVPGGARAVISGVGLSQS